MGELSGANVYDDGIGDVGSMERGAIAEVKCILVAKDSLRLNCGRWKMTVGSGDRSCTQD